MRGTLKSSVHYGFSLLRTRRGRRVRTGKRTSDLTDAQWEEKRATLDKHSMPFLNKNLVRKAPDVWNEAAIKQRALAL